jgi:hypothetical protein
MWTRLLQTLSLTAVASTVGILGSDARAGIDPATICKDRKLTASARQTQALSRAFGRNLKIPNSAKLAADVSKASSRLTKDFSAAESASSCLTTGDAAAIEAKDEALVADVLEEISPPFPPGFCPEKFVFTTALAGGICGRINDDSAGAGTDLVPYSAGAPALDCGTVYCGGGGSSFPAARVPDGATTIFDIVDCTDDTAMILGPADAASTGSHETCSAAGCIFGPPVPLPNAGSPGASACTRHWIGASRPVGGTINARTGEASIDAALAVVVQVTGDLEPAPGIQPCPTCTGGTCNSGSNSGGACTTSNSFLTSHDCPMSTVTLAAFGADASPLTTGTAVATDPGGQFCGPTTLQRTRGCFGDSTCEYIEVRGSPGGSLFDERPHATTLSSIYCIPKTSSVLINSVADLPGPGAISIAASGSLVE